MIRSSFHGSVLSSVALAAAVLQGAVTLNVRDFGAKGDGRSKDTAAIQAAIDESAKTGRPLDFPAGTYLSGTVYLKSGSELRLAEGAVIKGSPDRADYCAADAFPQNAASKADNTSGGHLIVAAGCTDITIRGPGKIDGNSPAFLVDPATRKQYPGGKLKIPWRPAQMIFIVDSRNVLLDGLEITDSPYWSCFILNCDIVTVRDCRVRTERRKFCTWNGDGIDVDRSSNVYITGCDIVTYDDAITLRASCAHRLSDPKDCHNVHVSDCTLASACTGVRIGVGEGTVRDCQLSRLKITDTRVGVSLYSSYSPKSRGTDIRDIRFTDVDADCRKFLDIRYGHATETEIRDIVFYDIRGKAREKNSIHEKKGMKYGPVSFIDFKVDGAM